MVSFGSAGGCRWVHCTSTGIELAVAGAEAAAAFREERQGE